MIKRIRGEIATKNLTPGRRVYGERLLRVKGEEYRVWSPSRSKLAAAIKKGLKNLPLESTSRVLYLGAAQGTTASHISDIVTQGVVYCIEFSAFALRKLLEVATYRKNMIPVLGDARKPEGYAFLLEEVDVLYQDIAQPDQSDILIKNAELFLKSRGYVMMAIKARSINSSLPPEKVFSKEVKKLKKAGFKVVQQLRLEPYEKDHAFLLLQKKT